MTRKRDYYEALSRWEGEGGSLGLATNAADRAEALRRYPADSFAKQDETGRVAAGISQGELSPAFSKRSKSSG